MDAAHIRTDSNSDALVLMPHATCTQQGDLEDGHVVSKSCVHVPFYPLPPHGAATAAS